MSARSGDEAVVHIGDPLRLRTRILIALALVALVALPVAAFRWNGNRWRDTPISGYRVASDPLRLELSLPTCNAEHRISVEETRTEIRLHAEHRNATTQDCADGLFVALIQPIGDRTIIDEGTDSPVPVER